MYRYISLQKLIKMFFKLEQLKDFNFLTVSILSQNLWEMLVWICICICVCVLNNFVFVFVLGPEPPHKALPARWCWLWNCTKGRLGQIPANKKYGLRAYLKGLQSSFSIFAITWPCCKVNLSNWLCNCIKSQRSNTLALQSLFSLSKFCHLSMLYGELVKLVVNIVQKVGLVKYLANDS